MKIDKVKLKLSKETTEVTQVHGSMKGKRVTRACRINKVKKTKIINDKEERQNEKDKIKEDLFHCKESCVCTGPVCATANLQECSSCHNILRSNCGKSGCKKDRVKPMMILPAASCS